MKGREDAPASAAAEWEIVDGTFTVVPDMDQAVGNDDISAQLGVGDYVSLRSIDKGSKRTLGGRQFSSIRQRKRAKREVSFAAIEPQHVSTEHIPPLTDQTSEHADNDEGRHLGTEGDGSNHDSREGYEAGARQSDNIPKGARVLLGVSPNFEAEPFDGFTATHPPVEVDEDDTSVLFVRDVRSRRPESSSHLAHDDFRRTAYKNALALGFEPEEASQAADAELKMYRETAENASLTFTRGHAKHLAMQRKLAAMHGEEGQTMRVAFRSGDADDIAGPATPGLGLPRAGNSGPLPSTKAQVPEEPEVETKGKDRADLSLDDDDQDGGRGRSRNRNLGRHHNGSPLKRSDYGTRSQSNMRGRSVLRHSNARTRRRDRSRRRTNACPSP